MNKQTEASAVSVVAGSDLHATADRLHKAIAVMLKDWRDGDFELSPLARIHIEHIEEKYLEVGKALRADNEAREKFQREALNRRSVDALPVGIKIDGETY